MRIKLSPSAVHSGAALASLLCAGKFKVGYFLDSLRIIYRNKGKIQDFERKQLKIEINEGVAVTTRC
jgi:hypothetical protein